MGAAVLLQQMWGAQPQQLKRCGNWASQTPKVPPRPIPMAVRMRPPRFPFFGVYGTKKFSRRFAGFFFFHLRETQGPVGGIRKTLCREARKTLGGVVFFPFGGTDGTYDTLFKRNGPFPWLRRPTEGLFSKPLALEGGEQGRPFRFFRMSSNPKKKHASPFIRTGRGPPFGCK